MSNMHFLPSRRIDSLEEMDLHAWVCPSFSPFLPSFQIIFRNTWEVRVAAVHSVPAFQSDSIAPGLCDLRQTMSPLHRLEIITVTASPGY